MKNLSLTTGLIGMTNSLSKHTVTLVVLIGVVFAAFSAQAQLGNRGSSTLGEARPQPLPIDQAFPFYVSIEGEDQITVSWQIAPQHYLYRHRFGFSLKSDASQDAQSLNFTLPDGLPSHDQFFGDIEAYYDAVTAHLDLPTGNLERSVLVIEYQGCADWGFCYPPQTTEFPFLP
jgi:thiol:disulfide interchange protein DsbD